jgi:hypothetical protein
MTKIKHNKKRNVGIVYELLVKNMSKFLLEENINSVNKIKKIIENNFNHSTELFKEYKAYRVLLQKDIEGESHAVSIMTSAKDIVKNINEVQLDKQKSKLIKDINYSFGKSFFYENLKNYKELATIQIVLNEWKKGIASNINQSILLEKKLISSMMEKSTVKITQLSTNKNSSNRLIMEIMTKKINEKYKNLSTKQKELIKKYTIYANDNNEELVKFLKENKDSALSSLKLFKINNDNNFLKEKINEVEVRVKKLDENIINDKNIIKFLTVTKLLEELNSEE